MQIPTRNGKNNPEQGRIIYIKKCYWVKEYYTIDGEIYFINTIPAFTYCEEQDDIVIEIKSFEELVELAEENKIRVEDIGTTFFRNRTKIFFAGELYPRSITEKNFEPFTFTIWFREFVPTMEQAMKYLTVEQFKEYVGDCTFNTMIGGD